MADEPSFSACPHCGLKIGGGYAGTPLCRQPWGGPPEAVPTYPNCILKRSKGSSAGVPDNREAQVGTVTGSTLHAGFMQCEWASTTLTCDWANTPVEQEILREITWRFERLRNIIGVPLTVRVSRRFNESSTGDATTSKPVDHAPQAAGPDRNPSAWVLPVEEKTNMTYLDLAEANQRISELEGAVRLQADDKQRDHRAKLELTKQVAAANARAMNGDRRRMILAVEFDAEREAREEAERELAAWLQLHDAIAEMLGTTSVVWPDHRNAPLAIAAAFALCEDAEARAAQMFERTKERCKAACEARIDKARAVRLGVWTVMEQEAMACSKAIDALQPEPVREYLNGVSGNYVATPAREDSQVGGPFTLTVKLAPEQGGEKEHG